MNKQFVESNYELDYDKPLWQLTMKEFLDIQKREMSKMIKEMLIEAVNETKVKEVSPNDTIDLVEAAKLTGLKPKSIYSKVSRLELPSITGGRPLVFSRAELQLWMKIGRSTVALMEFKRRKGEL